MEAISTLAELGFSRSDAARALHHADGNVDAAYAVSNAASACRSHCGAFTEVISSVSSSDPAGLQRRRPGSQ